MDTILQGMKKKVVIGDGQPTAMLGERINPTGKKKLAAALTAGDLEIVRQEALAQVTSMRQAVDSAVANNLLIRSAALELEAAGFEKQTAYY